MANSGLQGTQKDLVDEIMGVLTAKQGAEYCCIEMDVPDSDGNISSEKFPMAGTEGPVSFKTMLNPKTGSGGVSGNGVSGTEALVAVIVDKTLNHIIENLEVAWHERLEALDTDFNTFLTQMMTAATVITASPTLPPASMAGGGAALLAAVMAVKGPARTGLSSALKAKEAATSMTTNML